jgi:hypothetical protein
LLKSYTLGCPGQDLPWKSQEKPRKIDCRPPLRVAAMSVELAHRLAFELDAVGGMNDTATDGVGDGGVSVGLVLLGNGKLGTEKRGCPTLAVFQDLEAGSIG